MKTWSYVLKTTKAAGGIALAVSLALLGCDGAAIFSALRWWWARWRC